MNHQPYEDWLFAQDELSPEEGQELAAHLRQCEACKTLSTSWNEIEGLFSEDSIVGPAPGFSQRWKERMLLRKETNHHRQMSLILFLLSSATAILALPLSLQVALIAMSPERLVFDAIRESAYWLVWFGFLGDFTTTFLGSVVETIPVLWLLGSLAVICMLLVVWLILVYRFVPAFRKERSI
jgi:hypothetical protein